MNDFGKNLLKIAGYIGAIVTIWGFLTGAGGYVIEKVYHKEITEIMETIHFADSARTKIIPDFERRVTELESWKELKSKTKAIGLRKNTETNELFYRAGMDLRLYRAYYNPALGAYYYDFQGRAYECH